MTDPKISDLDEPRFGLKDDERQLNLNDWNDLVVTARDLKERLDFVLFGVSPR